MADIINEYTFNVEKKNTFIIVGGTYSGIEFTVVDNTKLPPYDPADSVENIIGLSTEFVEPSFQGSEEVDAILTAVVVDDATLSLMTKEDTKRQVNTSKTPGLGKIQKGMSDAKILSVMVNYIEGGYYNPSHAFKFSESDKSLYKNSGETLWGIDRYAGKTENESTGAQFWTAIDKISGYGDLASYSRKTPTGDWDFTSHPIRPESWGYGYTPNQSILGYDMMYGSFITYASNNLNNWLNTYIGNHPVKDLILNDSQFKFLWFRSTWNGIGWFSWYANGKKSLGIDGIKWAYENVSKNVDDLIVWDLNNRLKFNNHLVTHDVKKMKELLNIKY